MSPPSRRAALLALALLSVPLLPGAPAQSAEAPWTMLLYLNGDNDLESGAYFDTLEAEMGALGAARLIALVDYAEEGEADGYVALEPDITHTRLMELTPEGWVETADMGELDMTDPEVLSTFIADALVAHPAERYGLVLWNHGAGWYGIHTDDSAPDPKALMSLEMTAGAVRDGLAAAGVDRFDFLGFDACFMATLEVAEAMAPYADVMVASEEYEPNDGWDYAQLVDDLGAGLDARALAVSTVDAYIRFFREEVANPDVTLSALDLTRIGEVQARVDGLAAALETLDLQGGFDLARALKAAPIFPLPDSEDPVAVDLFVMAEEVASFDDPTAAAAARALLTLRDDFVIASKHNDARERAYGVTFLGTLDPFQLGVVAADIGYEPSGSSGALTRALETVGTAIEAGDEEDPVVHEFYALGSEEVVSGVESHYYLDVSDDNLAGIDLVLLSEDEEGNLLIEMTQTYLPMDSVTDEDGHMRGSWNAEEVLEIPWDGSVSALAVGDDLWLAPFEAMERGSPYYELTGTVTRPSGKEVPVLLRFDSRDGRMTAAYNQDANAETTLGPLDKFRFVWEGIDADGEAIEVETDDMLVGPQGLRLEGGYAPPGEYLLAIVATDLVDNVAWSERLPVTVLPLPEEGATPPPDEDVADGGTLSGDTAAAATENETPLGPLAAAALALGALARRRRA